VRSSTSEVALTFDGSSKLGMRLDPFEGTVLRIDPGTTLKYDVKSCAIFGHSFEVVACSDGSGAERRSDWLDSCGRRRVREDASQRS
jgi:hypothetical protein